MINVLDTVINAIDPVRGARRARARLALEMFGESSYNGASTSRRSISQFLPRPKSADEDTGGGLPLMRARSRNMYMNDPIATSAIRTTWTKVIGGGLTLQAKLDWKRAGLASEDEANAWKTNTEGEFRLFAETPECDITRTQTFSGLQGLMFLSALMSGDSFALLPVIDRPSTSVYSTRIQAIEADLVDTPKDLIRDAAKKIVNGVELDEFGAPVAYHVLKFHPGSRQAFSEQQKSTSYLAFNKHGRRQMCHMFDRERPGQTRGVPYLAPVMEPLKNLGKYTDAELMAAVVNSLLTVFIKTPAGDGMAPATEGATKRNGDDYQLGSGTILEGLPGDELETISVNRPNTAFDPFVQAILRQVGAALGLPFEVLMKHFTSSYSAARAALLEAWHFFKNRRQFVIDTFCRPVYEAWMEEAIALGRVSAPGFFDDPAIRAAYLQSEWMGDPPGQINPVDDATAAEKHLKMGTTTLEDETFRYSGKVYQDVHEQQVKERRMRKADGLPPSPGEESAQPAAVPPAGPEPDPNKRDKQKEDDNAAA